MIKQAWIVMIDFCTILGHCLKRLNTNALKNKSQFKIGDGQFFQELIKCFVLLQRLV